jgi:hypothetical protein
MIEIIAGCALILGLSPLLTIAWVHYFFVARPRRSAASTQPRSNTQAERQKLEGELTEVNRALTLFGTGQPFALIRGQEGQIVSFCRDEFGCLLARRCQLTLQLKEFAPASRSCEE